MQNGGGIAYSKLVDVPRLQSLLDSFHQVIGIANAVIDTDGVVIARAGWQDACNNFHRVNGETCRRCIESDTSLVKSMTQGAPYAIYNCHNGLVDTAAPIIVDDQHVANVFTGQFLTAPPDLEFFGAQARRFGFDEAAYLEAITRVPVLQQERVETITRLYAKLAATLASNGLDRLKQQNATEELRRVNAELEGRVAELLQTRDDVQTASRAKSIFLTTMSHELRTPMNGIMGMTGLALQRATDPKQADWLSKSQDAAKHLLGIINDILDTSKLESGQLRLEEQDFSPAKTINDAVRGYNAPAQDKGLSLSWQIDPALPDRLHGDAMRLRQILLNFTSNAIKFSEHGQITVRASVVEEDSRSVLLKIEVTDQGIGISPEQQARLFHAFVQADGSLTRKYGGTGLGLVIVKRLALLMGGDAGVSSQEGSGSTFWATLRLTRSRCPPPSPPGPSA